mmetsp:Transcript_22396/g.59145  ORF Transcript_22396/g.59145 Transcript_22396/m.59145 type:complete len:440 (+) Transcript_22396:233-1552(+)
MLIRSRVRYFTSCSLAAFARAMACSTASPSEARPSASRFSAVRCMATRDSTSSSWARGPSSPPAVCSRSAVMARRTPCRPPSSTSLEAAKFAWPCCRMARSRAELCESEAKAEWASLTFSASWAACAEASSIFPLRFTISSSRSLRMAWFLAVCSSQNCFSETSIWDWLCMRAIMSVSMALIFANTSSPVYSPRRTTASMLEASCDSSLNCCLPWARPLTISAALRPAEGSERAPDLESMSMEAPPAADDRLFLTMPMAEKNALRAFTVASWSENARLQDCCTASRSSCALPKLLLVTPSSPSACARLCSSSAWRASRRECSPSAACVCSADAPASTRAAAASAALEAFAMSASSSALFWPSARVSDPAAFCASSHQAARSRWPSSSAPLLVRTAASSDPTSCSAWPSGSAARRAAPQGRAASSRASALAASFICAGGQ